jgi:hypothetical protein
MADALTTLPSDLLFQDTDKERFEDDLRIIGEDTSLERSQKTADKKVRSAAESSLNRLHILQRGRCPECGDALRQHLFVSVCKACGWSSWSTPKIGGVRVHLVGGGEPIAGDAVYVVKNGVTIILRGDAVFARLPAHSVQWIEYVWLDEELRERERGLRERMDIACGWCGKDADLSNDGFHLVQVAFGTTQERYCFCSDECFEAFRKMYPARVHRNCYDRDCDECNLCIKRYRGDSGGMRSVPKDFLRTKDRA